MQPGQPAPDFKGNALVNGEFKTIQLSDYKGKYLIFFFYPSDFTFVCPTEIIAFSDRADEFRNMGAEVVGCSTDTVFSHLKWSEIPRKDGGIGAMNIPLLSDRNQDISRRYGVLKEEAGNAFRGLFLIDPKGILRQITINDMPLGRSVDEALRLVQACKFTDEHGEVCPANWKPGAATIKPNPKDSKQFFQQAN